MTTLQGGFMEALSSYYYIKSGERYYAPDFDYDYFVWIQG